MDAYPNASYATAGAAASKILARPEVRAEIIRLRTQAQTMAGSAVMTLIEKRSFLARVVRARIALLPNDSDLWDSVRHFKESSIYRLPNKIQAIIEDNHLAGLDTETAGYDSLTQWDRCAVDDAYASRSRRSAVLLRARSSDNEARLFSSDASA